MTLVIIFGPHRDIDGSRAFLLDADRKYRMNSTDVFFDPDQYLKINNTTLEPDMVARQIAAHFSLPLTEDGG